MKTNIKQFQHTLRKIPPAMQAAAADAMYDAAKIGAKKVRENIEGRRPFPLIDRGKLLSSTKSTRHHPPRRIGRHLAATYGTYAPYTAALEYGAAPFTPPLAPLIEWAKRTGYNVRGSGNKRRSKIRSTEKGSTRKGGTKKPLKRNRQRSRNAEGLAMAIQKKYTREGIKPAFFFAKARAKMDWQTKNQLRKHLKRKVASKYPVRIRVYSTK